MTWIRNNVKVKKEMHGEPQQTNQIINKEKKTVYESTIV